MAAAGRKTGRGKSGLHRAGRWVTPTRGDPRKVPQKRYRQRPRAMGRARARPRRRCGQGCNGGVRAHQRGGQLPRLGKPRPEQGQAEHRFRRPVGVSRESGARCSGRPHEAGGDAGPREMATLPSRKRRGGQKPAYRPASRREGPRKGALALSLRSSSTSEKEGSMTAPGARNRPVHGRPAGTPAE